MLRPHVRLRDTPGTMSEESATNDPVELARRFFESISRRDLDAALALAAPDALVVSRLLGETFEGRAAIRAFAEGWLATFEEFVLEPYEMLDLGSGVVFATVHQDARPVGRTVHIRVREAWAFVCAEGRIVWGTVYPNIDEGRAAAERLASERV